ncbi:MAG: YceI family protein [Chitinophagaceae bacterium]|nr:YceI family protein [Chitinophagaceae bacterium]
MANTTWKIDSSHSEILFKVKHLMITTVTGHFKTFDAVAETTGDDFSDAKNIKFTADVDSIETNNEQRNGHLKSAEFFNGQEFPQIKFAATEFKIQGEEGKLNGELTMRGVTKPITLKVEFGGTVTDPYGQTKAGFTLEGKVNRKEFGLTWNAVTEAGSVVVSEEVKIHAEIQLIKQA